MIVNILLLLDTCCVFLSSLIIVCVGFLSKHFVHIYFFKRAASTSGEGMDCKPEKMLRKDSNSGDGDGDGDVMMEDRESVKQIAIKKKRDVADKKKR